MQHNNITAHVPTLARRLRSLIWWSVVSGCTAVWAADVAVMPPDSLRAGMKGHGRTVFSGTRIDSFGVEILGVQRNAMRPGRHLILARLSGAGLEETGVIQGMSGSPVYIDGRLVGAVAYSWAFSRAPLCGITPIGDMLEVMRRPMEAPSDSAGWSPMAEMAGAVDTPLEIEIPAHLADVDSPAEERLQTGRVVRLEPLGAPVWLAGATPAAQEVLRELLGPIGFLAIGASGGDAMGEHLDAGASALEDLLKPGASLGVRFVDGDLSATAIGTLTYVDGERLVGFGHRLFPVGAVDMPMTGAHIYEVLPSVVSSFKIGAGTYPIGALRQDRFSGVAGLIGAKPHMLPVEVIVRSSAGERVYEFRLLRHVDFTAGLTNAVLLTAMESQATVFGASTLKVEAAFRLRRGEWMRHSQVYGGPGAAFAAARDAINPLARLMRSSFDGLEVDSLRFEVSVGEGMETARVTSVRLDHPVCRPGDEVVCRVTVKPYRSAPAELIFRLTVPRDLDPGPVVIRVGSGLAAAQWALDRRPDAAQPRDADHLLELLTRDQRADELVVEMSRQELSVSIDGRELPGLPASARAALRESHGSGRMQPVFGRVVGQRRLELPYVLTGEHSVELSVRKR